MTVSRQKRQAWEAKLKKLAASAQRAADDVLVGIHQAKVDGISQADIARSLGESPSGVKAKADKGEKILLKRKGASRP